MKDLTKAIREATDLSMDEFCAKYLDCDWRTFSVRERKQKLYPNEALLICLMTGKNPVELFGMSSMELFCLQGKNKKINKRIKELLKKTDAVQKMNLILSNPEGLRLVTDMSQDDQPVVKKKEPKKEAIKKVTPVVNKASKKSDFDFVDVNVFR
jgi:hypothetical protein